MQLLDHGFNCVIYKGSLLEDPEAMKAIMTEDNLDADVRMREDTMTIFGSIDTLWSNLESRNGEKDWTLAEIMVLFKRMDTKKHDDDSIKALINFRAKLHFKIAEVFRIWMGD